MPRDQVGESAVNGKASGFSKWRPQRQKACFSNVSPAVVGTDSMGDTRDVVAEMYEKLVFPSSPNDVPLIVRF